ncbi:unnamed protein product [Pleuronectes platessa]|uniref:Uncharacterized protein n=1 Tax=Pleuronectes platessa TaxID=8262 RepID=A0A9N7U851_PLEPL|nr:unnamed protein product [Pleuronectes platessa]
MHHIANSIPSPSPKVIPPEVYSFVLQAEYTASNLGLAPGDTHCPHSVTIKKPRKMPRSSKTVHYRLPGGSADAIKEWYRLQIMHVSALILVLSEGKNRTARGCTAAPQRPRMLNNARALTDQGHLLTREVARETASHINPLKSRLTTL